MNARTTANPSGVRPADNILLATALMLLGLGLVMVLSSSAFFARKHIDNQFFFFLRQLLFAGIGLVGLVVASRFNYQNYRRLVYPLLFFTLALLTLVLIPGVGKEVLGARRWLMIGPVTVQPSELAKLTLIIYLSYSLSKRREIAEGFMTGFFNHLIVPMIVLCLILVAPDFGTMFLLLAVTLLMLFVGGSPLRYLIGTMLALTPLLALMVVIFPHSLYRLKAFLNQLAFLGSQQDYRLLCYQVRESIISFGSGGLWGLGLGEGTMKMFFLPQAHSDFILATYGQELGFAGTIGLFALLGILIIRGYLIALRVPDTFGCFLAFGLTTLIAIQFSMNAGVVLGLLPPKGIALPFISYGGSALVANLLAIGILLNISRYTVRGSNLKGGI